MLDFLEGAVLASLEYPVVLVGAEVVGTHPAAHVPIQKRNGHN